MARLARSVFPGLPHHVTRRGNGRAQTVFIDEAFIGRLEQASEKFGDGSNNPGLGKRLTASTTPTG